MTMTKTKTKKEERETNIKLSSIKYQLSWKFIKVPFFCLSYYLWGEEGGKEYVESRVQSAECIGKARS